MSNYKHKYCKNCNILLLRSPTQQYCRPCSIQRRNNIYKDTMPTMRHYKKILPALILLFILTACTSYNTYPNATINQYNYTTIVYNQTSNEYTTNEYNTTEINQTFITTNITTNNQYNTTFINQTFITNNATSNASKYLAVVCPKDNLSSPNCMNITVYAK